MNCRSAAALIFTFTLHILPPSGLHAQEAIDGARMFQQRCASCHGLEAGQKKLGPHLDGIIGRRAGSIEGVRYSRAMQYSQIVWNEQSLDEFLANPRKALAGTTMIVGVPDAEQRKALIAYLAAIAN